MLAYSIVSEGVFGFLEGSIYSLLYEMYMSNGGPDGQLREGGRTSMHRDLGVG